MAAFIQFRMKTCINIKYLKKRGTPANLPRHTVWETLLYTVVYPAVARRTPISNAGIENVGSASCAKFTHCALA